MSKKAKEERRCYLCGGLQPDTKEHIPPRGIFPKMPKGDLITVPAHAKCNNDFSQDDEFFRNVIITESGGTAQGRRGWYEQVVPSFTENPGARKGLQQRLEMAWVKLRSGAYIPKDVLLVEASLYDRQINRITRGLSYHKF